MGLLDRARQCPRQPDVRLCPRHGYELGHLRLGPDRIHWFPVGNTMVG